MIVFTAAQLIAALKLGVTIIALAPGSYNDVRVINHTYSNPVTIESLDQAHSAVFSGCFNMANSSGIVVKGLKIDFSGCKDPFWPGRVDRVKNIKFDNVEIVGMGATSGPGGFLIVDSEKITFTNCRFHHLGSVALNIARGKTFVIKDNEFSDWDKSAVGIGQINGLIFTRNVIHDARPTPGTHPDGLQMFTTNTKIPSSDIFIDNNTMYAGDGGAFQGIFIQDETGKMPYENVQISRNLILGSMWNAIYLKNATGRIKITDNQTYSWKLWNPTATTDSGKPTTTAFTAGILLWTAPGAELTETGNSAQRFSRPDGSAGPVPPGNSLATGQQHFDPRSMK
jgi:hypothetical protein